LSFAKWWKVAKKRTLHRNYSNYHKWKWHAKEYQITSQLLFNFCINEMQWKPTSL
jgi:hypothetical protein